MYVEKVFNWSEVHFSEMTCYKIHTLEGNLDHVSGVSKNGTTLIQTIHSPMKPFTNVKEKLNYIHTSNFFAGREYLFCNPIESIVVFVCEQLTAGFNKK